MIQSAFWNGFLEGLAAPIMAFEPVTLPDLSDPPLLELDEIVPPKSVIDDMAAVRGDFIRALERTT